eukprot:3194848-Pyramimonas_sp.AAC.1
MPRSEVLKKRRAKCRVITDDPYTGLPHASRCRRTRMHAPPAAPPSPDTSGADQKDLHPCNNIHALEPFLLGKRVFMLLSKENIRITCQNNLLGRRPAVAIARTE